MAAPINPALVRAFGQDSWAFVTAIADPDEPTVAELEAATGINLSLSVFGEQEGFTAETAKVTLPRKLAETQTYQANGETTFGAADLMVSYDPQAAANAEGKKAWVTLADNAEGFLVRRQGKDGTSVFAAGDFVDVVPAQLGTKVPTKTATDAAGVYAFTQAVSIVDRPRWNKVVVA